MKKNIILLFVFCLLFVPALSLAKIGVGVGTGKIQVSQQLKPGGLYDIPVLSVINTGDEPSSYEIGVAYHEDQPELWPAEEWFVFSPANFHLEPGEAQTVKIKLNLPLKVIPGDYFAFLEGRPVQAMEVGQTSVGIAAAAKLYFTVAPANVFQAVYYKTLSFFNNYSPWPQIVLAVIILAILISLFRKKFSFRLKIDKK